MNTMNNTGTSEESSHRQAWDLIPWVVSGGASAEDCQRVHRHAAVCADCSEELAFHRDVKAAMNDTAPTVHDGEPALQRLLARIDAAEPRAAPAEVLSLPAHRRRGVDWTRYLAAAVVVQALGLATLAGLLLDHPRQSAYQTLSLPAHTLAQIRLVPASSLTLAELQALLARRDLQIVESSADGAILGLAPRPGSRLNIADALAALRVDPGVLLAEPIAPTPGPRP